AGIDPNWYDAHATFYGGPSGAGAMHEACGYGDLYKQGYRLANTALSTTLFNNGATCGACFQLVCVNILNGAERAQDQSRVIPVKYRSVSCVKQGDARFEINENPTFLFVLVFNVANVGDVYRVSV
ncbi:expansin-a23-like protein, partial [Trifolium pratense]